MFTKEEGLPRILAGGIVGALAFFPLGGLFNSLVFEGRAGVMLLSPFLRGLAGDVGAFIIELILYFGLGAAVGIATLPFAEDTRLLLTRSATHFAVTAVLFMALTLASGWNMGELLPLILEVGALAVLYLAIWFTRWIGWYFEVEEIKKKLGLK